jgi:hypothetical protein
VEAAVEMAVTVTMRMIENGENDGNSEEAVDNKNGQ